MRVPVLELLSAAGPCCVAPLAGYVAVRRILVWVPKRRSEMRLVHSCANRSRNNYDLRMMQKCSAEHCFIAYGQSRSVPSCITAHQTV